MTVIAVSVCEKEAAVAATQAKAPWASEPTPMSAEAFLGRWKDSIGHDVSVEISEDVLKATLTKPEGSKPKELCVHMDHFQQWRCGNGILNGSKGLVDHKDSDSTQGQPLSLSWVTWNGKVSTWTRCADKANIPVRDAEAWWKITQEWDMEDVPKMIAQKMQVNNGKETEQQHQPAIRSSCRRGNRGQGQGQQQRRKAVECQA